MEDYQYEMINLFNKNFKCNDVRKILKLYKKDISLKEYFQDINLKEEKYQHPLFLNYNYCLFCGQRKKTKYYSQNIINSHMELEDKTLGQYLLNNNIKLKPIKNKKAKISNRRFIHSYKNLYTNNNLNNIKNNDSDTDLYIYKKKHIKKSKRKGSNISNNIRINSDNIKQLKISLVSNEHKKAKRSNSKQIKNVKNIYDDIDDIIPPKKENNLIPISSERKIDSENSINIEKQLNIKEEEIKTDVDNEKEFSIINSNIVLDIKPSNELNSKKVKKRNNKNEQNLIETTNLNTENKLNKDSIIKREKNSDISVSNEMITKNENNKEEDKLSNKSIKLLNVINKTKKFLGFGKKNSENLSRRRTLPGHYFMESNNAMLSKQNTKDSKFKQKNKNFIEKNDNCSICLQEIKEKFTLICGDFFCRDCIRNTIITAIKEISTLDKLKCPLCDEKIEENTIKKLLTEEEFQKYQNLITKIEGLKNHNYIPCPYPDCPGWKDETTNNNNNIVYCQYEHTFCKKCLEILDNIFRLNNSEHKCYQNISEEETQTMEFFKKNKSFRKCPNCRSMVVREGKGCNNMTCTNVWCGHEFCWICNMKYDESHYKNPLSMCFGLSEMNYEGKLAKYKRVRFCRCMLIFILISFVLLPVVIVFFSLFAVILYIISFVLDGSYMKNIKLNSMILHKLFYKIIYLFFIMIGIAYIPVGYMSLAGICIIAPIYCIINKIRMKNDDELD